MNKYFLKTEFINDKIITKNSDGQDTLVTAETFNDYFAEMMIKAGQGHLIQANTQYVESGEKKSFEQISDDVILLTSTPEQIAENLQNQTAKEPALKRKRGRQPKQPA